MAWGNAFRRVVTLWALLGGVLLLVIVLATAINAAGFTANTLARIWGGSVAGLPGYEDGVTMLVGVAALAMFPYCQLVGGHAAVDVFLERAPAWADRAINVFSAVLMAVVALALAAMLAQGTLEVRSDRTETAVLGWPVWIFMPTAVFSCLLWALAALQALFKTPEADNGP